MNWDLFRKEPVRVTALIVNLVLAVSAAAVAFGFGLSAHQIGTVVAAVGPAVLFIQGAAEFLVRPVVTPVDTAQKVVNQALLTPSENIVSLQSVKQFDIAGSIVPVAKPAQIAEVIASAKAPPRAA